MDWKIITAIILGALIVAAIVSRVVYYFLKKSYEDVIAALQANTAQIGKQNGRIGTLEEWRLHTEKRMEEFRVHLHTKHLDQDALNFISYKIEELKESRREDLERLGEAIQHNHNKSNKIMELLIDIMGPAYAQREKLKKILDEK